MLDRIMAGEIGRFGEGLNFQIKVGWIWNIILKI